MLRVEPELKSEYVANGEVSLAFWHVLDHGDASRMAHIAAECAGQQDPLAFWQLHDQLFAEQNRLWGADQAVVTELAASLDLDTIQFEACLADEAVAAKVARLDQERRDQGIRLRPSFLVNETRIEGGVPLEAFATTIDGLLGR